MLAKDLYFLLSSFRFCTMSLDVARASLSGLRRSQCERIRISSTPVFIDVNVLLVCTVLTSVTVPSSTWPDADSVFRICKRRTVRLQKRRPESVSELRAERKAIASKQRPRTYLVCRELEGIEKNGHRECRAGVLSVFCGIHTAAGE